eukprot:2679461-Amphidinium_carterae.1
MSKCVREFCMYACIYENPCFGVGCTIPGFAFSGHFEVHLNEDLYILDDSPRLAALLLSRSSMRGSLFTDLIPMVRDQDVL